MLIILATALALAGDLLPSEYGTLVIDSRLPSEILVDGEQIAEVYRASTVSLRVPAGVRRLRVYTNGNPADLEAVVPAGGELSVLVGRTGLSLDQGTKLSTPVDIAAGDVAIQFRMADKIGARLVLDKKRYEVGPGEQLELELPTGSHQVSVRSEDGTVIWATGQLKVDGPDPVVVQLSEGRLPEVSGRGAFASGK